MLDDELSVKRPDLLRLKEADEVLGPGWELIVAELDHFVIDSEDGAVASVGRASSSFCLDVESAESFVQLRNSVHDLLEYIDYLERVTARLEHRLDDLEGWQDAA